MSEKIVAYIDGGSRGNPGPAAAGYVLCDEQGNQLQAKGIFLGQKTNNEAEYNALVKMLEAALQIGAEKIMIFSDSELLVRQVQGKYKVKSEKILPLYEQAVELLLEFTCREPHGRAKSWAIQHVMREKNSIADGLVNQALDENRNSDRNRDSKRNSVTNPLLIPTPKLRLGVLMSGGGRTLLNLQENIKAGRLNAQVVLVISSLTKVAGVERAKKAGFDVKIIRKKEYPEIEEFSKQIVKELDAANVDLVIQAGWLCLWEIPEKYENHVMNIHPALLPCFGGQGMWGHNVHEAVLKAGCKVSGCTVHFCTNEYDKGPIIVQRTCPAYDTDTPDTLAARVFEQECIAYPEAINLFSEGKLIIQDGIVKIKK